MKNYKINDKKLYTLKLIALLIIMLSFFFIPSFVNSILAQDNNANNENNPDTSWIDKIQGDKYYYLKDYSNAIIYYNKALQKKIDYPEVYYMLGKIYKEKQLYDLSIYYFGLAEKYKNNFEIKEFEIYLYYDISETLFYLKKYMLFLDYNFKILKKDFNFKYYNRNIYSLINILPEGYSIYGKAYFRIGYYYFFSGNFQKALKYLVYSRIYKYREDISYFLLSKIFFLTGDMTEYKKNESIAYSLNNNLKLFDSKINWKTIPFSQEYIIKLEQLINEFNGHFYLKRDNK